MRRIYATIGCNGLIIIIKINPRLYQYIYWLFDYQRIREISFISVFYQTDIYMQNIFSIIFWLFLVSLYLMRRYFYDRLINWTIPTKKKENNQKMKKKTWKYHSEKSIFFFH